MIKWPKIGRWYKTKTEGSSWVNFIFPLHRGDNSPSETYIFDAIVFWTTADIEIVRTTSWYDYFTNEDKPTKLMPKRFSLKLPEKIMQVGIKILFEPTEEWP